MSLVIKNIGFEHFKLDEVKRIILTLSIYLLAIILMISGVSKIINPLPTIETLGSVNFLNGKLNVLVATLLPITEIGLSLMLFTKSKIKVTTIIASLLFLIFFLFSVYGFYLGLENDCGCFGNVIKSSFGWGMILRNFILFCISLFLIFNINVLQDDK